MERRCPHGRLLFFCQFRLNKETPVPIVTDYRVTDADDTFPDIRLTETKDPTGDLMYVIEQNGTEIELSPDMLSDLQSVIEKITD